MRQPVAKNAFLRLLAPGAALSAVLLLSATCSGPAPDPTSTASTQLPQSGASDNTSSSPAVTLPASSIPSATHNAPQSSKPQSNPPLSIQARFDCIRTHGALVAAHRGGPRRGYPENALETLAETYARGTRVFEIDVSQSRDGVLFLLHDDTLDRTTTGHGAARDQNWDTLSRLKLTTYDDVTPYAIPTLRDVLDWAVSHNAILELDKKQSASLSDTIAEVRAAGAENHVVMITYSLNQAGQVARLAPELMMTASINAPRDIDTLLKRGVKPDNLIAWTGTDTLDPALWKAASARGVEVAFGTLGRRGDRFDDDFWADRNGAEYDQLAADGVDLIATDFSDRVTRSLKADDDAISACGL